MASKAQLAALAKARAARKKKPVKKIPVNAKSRVTGKAPSKRLKARRAKNTRAGYYPNPVKKTTPRKFTVRVTLASGKVGYVTPSGGLDTDIGYAVKKSETECNKLAHSFFAENKKYLKSVEVVVVKKPSAGYGKNPVPASKALKQKEAAFLFEDFTGHKADHFTNHTINLPDVGLKFGECTGIMYETTRDGVKEYYCHEFKKSARPLLGASHDGKQLLLVGGNYRFTNRGIVDN